MELTDKVKQTSEVKKTSTGNLIRLSDIYKNPCGSDEYVEVSDEILMFLIECQKREYRDYSSNYRHIAPINFNEDELGAVYHAFEQGADECFFIKLQSDELYSALQQIKPEFAKRFYLYHAVGMTMEQIAGIEGVSRNAVSKSVRKAALLLRQLMCNSDNENT